MDVFIALLRGINVGGKNKIPMAGLKRMFENIRLSNVQTYIQSGNVLFMSNDDETSLRGMIEREIESVFGFHVPVVLRTAAELEKLAESCPFSKEEIAKAKSLEYETLYVALLTDAPGPERLAILNKYGSKTDRYKRIDRDIFLLLGRSIRDSKLAGNLHRLDVPLTVRNFKTLTKLAELAKCMIDSETIKRKLP